VHPLEYLRAVSRHRSIPAAELAIEFARAVGEWSFDGPELVLASRRMLEHRGDASPLWWATSMLVTAPSVVDRAFAVVDALSNEGDDVPMAAVPVAAATPDEVIIVSPWVDRLDDDAVTGRVATLWCPVGYLVRPEYLDRIMAGLDARGDRPRRIRRGSQPIEIDGTSWAAS
jgi:hypothetical protein